MGTSLHARPRCSLPAHNQRSRHLGLPARPCSAAQHQRLPTLLPQVNLQAPRGPLVVAAAVASSPLPGTPSTSGSSSSSSSSYQFGDYGAELSWRQNIASKYVMGHAVGQGSFGTAYLAISLETGRDCCVKQLIKQRAKLSRERTLEKLCREVEILERLQGCPAVVKLVDLFEDESYVYIVTELCSGGDLQKLSDSLGPFNERGVALVAQEVLKVVHACHEAGILHGDVKPANFVLQHKSRTPLSSADPKLRQAPWLKAIDFGCSQVFANGSEARRLSKRTGTPVYMAPEIFARDYSVEADMWSTGVMLYQLFSRQFPFWDTSSTCRATNLEEIAEAVTNAEIKFDYGPWLEMSEEGLDFVKRCLVRDPTKRMTVAEAMAHPWFGTMLHHLDEKVYANVSNNIVPSPMAARREATAPAAAGVPAPAA